MALIVVLSVMNGFDREIKSRLLQVVPHITGTSVQGVSAAEIDQLRERLLDGQSPVISVTPMAHSFVMLSYQQNLYQQTNILYQQTNMFINKQNLYQQTKNMCVNYY